MEKHGFALRNFVFFLFSLPLIFVFAASIAAQTVSGIVTDLKRAPVQNAQVSLLEQKGKIAQTVTDAEGKFSIDLPNSGNLRLLVEANGFANFEKTLPKNFSETLNIVLE